MFAYIFESSATANHGHGVSVCARTDSQLSASTTSAPGKPQEIPLKSRRPRNTQEARLEALLRSLEARLNEPRHWVDENSHFADLYCTMQSSIETWSAKIATTTASAKPTRTAQPESWQAEPAQAVNFLIGNLARIVELGLAAGMTAGINEFLDEYALRPSADQPEPAASATCPQSDLDNPCRAARKARMSGRAIDCSECAESAPKTTPRQSQHDWADDCAAYPEAIARTLSADHRGHVLTPTSIEQWERQGLLTPCNADSINGTKTLARSTRKMYLVKDVAHVWRSGQFLSLFEDKFES